MRHLVFCIAALAACGKGNDEPKPAPAPVPADPRPAVEQVKPPIDLKSPPKDAVKTASGLVYKKLVEKADGVAPKRNDTVAVNYTGWKSDGVTFFTNRAQGQPMVLSLATTSAGFAEALQLVKKGEKAIVWIPPGLDKNTTETLVYEFDVVEVVPAPAVPEDLKTPPSTAKVTPHGAKYVVVTPGSGERAREFDTVTFHYTAWDSDGRMFESTETRKRPATSIPYRQPAVFADVLVLAGKGARVRVWTDSLQVGSSAAGVPSGPLVYEFQIEEIVKAPGTPAPVPANVAAAPAGASTTKSGVAFEILKKGKGGPKPGPTDEVTIVYTGWTTDGRLIGSSELEGKPAHVRLDDTITGWTDAIMTMSAGDRVRMWIPPQLAYKGASGKPQGTLVYDLELVAFGPKQTAAAETAPADVAAPPKDAKQSPSGVAYKILKAKPGKKPTPKDTVRVVFTGWTTDGKVFDSSKGKPYETKLTNVIDGWAETIPLMSVGEKARLWIPERLAYAGAEGAPAGMLVFDIELLEIVK